MLLVPSHRSSPNMDPTSNTSTSTPPVGGTGKPRAARAGETSKCQCPKHSGRNLVVCIDGTSNKFDEKVRDILGYISLEMY